MEKEIKVTPYKIEYICDRCGEGKMVPNGIMKMSSPPLWEHTCSNFCGKHQDFLEKYPYIRYKEEENE